MNDEVATSKIFKNAVIVTIKTARNAVDEDEDEDEGAEGEEGAAAEAATEEASAE